MDSERRGNFSQKQVDDREYPDICTVVTVQVFKSPSIEMQNIDSLVKTILDHPNLKPDGQGFFLKFRASEVEFTLESKQGGRIQDPIEGEQT